MAKLLARACLAISWASLFTAGGLAASPTPSTGRIILAFAMALGFYVIWFVRDSMKQLRREQLLRSETNALRWRTSEAYSECSCGAYRKDQENHAAPDFGEQIVDIRASGGSSVRDVRVGR